MLLELVRQDLLKYLQKRDNMNKEEFENIIKLQGDLKDQPNSKLIEVMDKLTTEFDLTKDTIIKSTLYLDKVEELYNNVLNEYQSRK